MPLKIVIVGGVAGGASAAAKSRRTNEAAEIVMLEKGPYVSFQLQPPVLCGEHDSGSRRTSAPNS